jgi:hypothetical protein
MDERRTSAAQWRGAARPAADNARTESSRCHHFLLPAATHNKTMDTLPLVAAIQTLNTPDVFRPRFGPDQWRLFMAYLTRHEVGAGRQIIKQGDLERTAYFLEQGSLTVFVTAPKVTGQRLAILRAGSVVGEPALFGDHARMANVETMTPCVIWELSGLRLDELMASKPALAMELLRALGSVMAVRMRANLENGTPIT